MEDADAKTSAASTFADLGLDPRLLLALEKRQYETPTTVQVRRGSLTILQMMVDPPDLLECTNRETVEQRTGESSSKEGELL